MDAAPASAPPVGPRRAWLAALVTFVAPSVGHVYAGRPLRGLAAWAIALAVSVSGLALSMGADSRGGRLLGIGLMPLAALGLVADAAWTACRADPAAPRRPYQRPAVYLALALGVILVSDLFVLPAARSRWHAFTVASGSMAPTLLTGDWVMTARGVPDPRRGMVVTRMTDEGFEAVNRIVGLPGDTLRMRDGALFVNGRAETGRVRARDYGVSEDFDWQRAHLVGDTAGYAPSVATWGPLVVPDGHVFTMGDDRENSLDSRHLGFIPRERLTGRARWIYFSREPLTGEVRWHRIGSAIR